MTEGRVERETFDEVRVRDLGDVDHRAVVPENDRDGADRQEHQTDENAGQRSRAGARM